METSGYTTDYHCNDFCWEEHATKCQLVLQTREEANFLCGTKGVYEYSEKAQRSWETFHRINKGHFYKPRNYLGKEFPELLNILEIGCGYGSSILPLLESASPNTFIHACDFSPEAIRIFKENPLYDETRCNAFVCDIVSNDISEFVPKESIDVVLMVFALSAIPPQEFQTVKKKVYEVLRPGGTLCIRDYGLYDLSMMRSQQKLDDCLYYRSDGTLAYFFSTAKLRDLFCHVPSILPSMDEASTESSHFEQVENHYCTIRLKNRKKSMAMDRVWIHGKFTKQRASINPSVFE